MQDRTVTSLRRELHRKLTIVGHQLDSTRDPEIMRALISQRKRLQASLAVTEASITRVNH
jgi:hypothetical protein